MLKIACDHIEQVREPGGDGPHYQTVTCNQEAEMVILFAGFSEEEHTGVQTFTGFCSDHASEGAHEVRQDCNDDEYRIVVLSKPTEKE